MSRRPQWVAHLPAKNRELRLQFSWAHQGWTTEDWMLSGFDFCSNIWMVESDFGINSRKAWILPCMPMPISFMTTVYPSDETPCPELAKVQTKLKSSSLEDIYFCAKQTAEHYAIQISENNSIYTLYFNLNFKNVLISNVSHVEHEPSINMQ